MQEGLSNAKKTGDDKKLQAVASRRKKLDDRLGMEKNAKGHRLRINRHVPPSMGIMPPPGQHDTICTDAQARRAPVLMWHAESSCGDTEGTELLA